MAAILMVDDNEELCEALAAFLERAGHTVVTARSGQAALRLLADRSFDLVITDVVMRDMDGLELMRELRRRAPAISVIAISGGGRIDASVYLDVAQKLGAARTLVKPFAAATLLDAVTEILGEAAD